MCTYGRVTDMINLVVIFILSILFMSSSTTSLVTEASNYRDRCICVTCICTCVHIWSIFVTIISLTCEIYVLETLNCTQMCICLLWMWIRFRHTCIYVLYMCTLIILTISQVLCRWQPYFMIDLVFPYCTS